MKMLWDTRPDPLQKLKFLALYALLSLISIRSSFGGQTEVPTYGGTLRFGSHRDLSSLNPFFSTSSETRRMRSLSYEPLLTYDGEFRLAPDLATSWQVSEDGKTYTLTLRRGVKFHNGQEMVADDVKWCFDYILDPQNKAYGRGNLISIQSVETIGQNSVRLRMKDPFAPLLSNLSGIGSFSVIPRGALQPGDMRPKSAPLGTGPYRLVDWKRSDSVFFEKFSDYWRKGLPYTDRVILRYIPDETVRHTALRTGELEIISRLPNTAVERIKKGETPEIRFEESTYSDFRRLVFNVQLEPFKDKRVRQAVAYAIDKGEFIDGAFLGLGVPTRQHLVPGSPFYFKEIPDRKTDLEKSRSLLQAAGYWKGLKFKSTGRQGYEAQMQVLQAQLKHAGIEMEIEILDVATSDARHQKGEFLLAPSGAEAGVEPDATYYHNFHSDPSRVGNRSGYQNPEMDRLLEESRKTTNFEKRRQIYRRIDEILNEDVPEIALVFTPRFFGVQSYVKGFRVDDERGEFYFSGEKTGLPYAWLEKKK
jgi:peptide/nickel transport system substrate-binding protein